MTDPERLSRNPPSPLARLLLRASTEEKPSAATLRRITKAAAAAAATSAVLQSASAAGTAASVKVAAVNATGGSLLPTGTTIAFGTIAKWFGVGALGGLIAAPLVHVVIPAQGAKHAESLPAVLTQQSDSDKTPRSTAIARRAPELAPSGNPSSLESPNTVEARRIRRPDPPPGEPHAPAQTEAALLAAEVRFVDQGRAALQRGALDETLDLLAAYEGKFPRQQLLTEVLFLRMEAFSRSGDASQARSLAARVITRGVPGPQAARAREVLGR
jgi:hypothetical protein